MEITTVLLTVLLFVGLVTLMIALLAWRAARPGKAETERQAAEFARNLQATEQKLLTQFQSATADLTARLEQTRASLRQEIADRTVRGLSEVRTAVEDQLASGREEQARRLDDIGARLDTNFDRVTGRVGEGLAAARTELAQSMKATTDALGTDFDALNRRTVESLERIRAEVDQKLTGISQQVQLKLDQNIREGFSHFEKVQEHLRRAEEQLRNVGALGSSISDLNNLLKLPHLRGRFGEASLERLLADFLPAHMYELQAAPAPDSPGRADAVIKFPQARLPIDAKFPREQVLPLFESSDPAQLAGARERFERTMKEQARRICAYIRPENGTTDMALMYLPSETLYFETVLNGELSEFLNRQRVFPVSPNTLIVTLQAIAMVHSWYEVAQSFKQTREELAKARKIFGLFQTKFDSIGNSLDKAREAYDTAKNHLSRYRSRVTGITGEETPALDDLPNAPLLTSEDNS